jgi:hypothetical protein
MLKRIFNNKLLIAKIFFSLYNLIIIMILNVYFEAKLAGELLYIQGMIYLFAAISRAGSDYYWVSLDSTKILISKNEISIIFFNTVLCAFFYNQFLTTEGIYDFMWIFTSIFLVNIINFLGRIYQKEEKHILSIFMFLLAPSIFVVPILWFFRDIDLYMLLSISMLFMLVIILIFNKIQINFEYTNASFFKRLNFFPMILYGVVNQNLIATLCGLTGKEEESSLLVLFQKISGLILWPQIFHMQKQLSEINRSLKSIFEFKNYLKKYIKENIVPITFYIILALFIGFVFMIKLNNMNLNTIIALILVLLSAVVNVFLGYLQFQIGSSQNGLYAILILFFSLILAFFISKFFYISYIIVVLSFLLFHLINHLSNYFIITRWLKNV